MKKIILTIDYELFLGEKSGSVEECMIEPTSKLASILEKYNSKMTIFWDILHYYKLLEMEQNFSELKKDRVLIEQQILELAKNGHDFQLHLHPHWLDAKYENSKWKFIYDRFKLQSLSNERRIEDINTIVGCVFITKKLMEDLIKKVKPDYKVNAFRAGGYLIEPFAAVRDALLINDILIDSSVCPNIIHANGKFAVDFGSYPQKTKYNFEYTPKEISNTGRFVEIPITTVRIPALVNMLFIILRKMKYSNIESERKGSGTSEYSKFDKNNMYNKLHSLIRSKQNQFTTDSNFMERFSYLFKKVPDFSTMILHPKLLNVHTLGIIDEYLSSNKIRFVTIQDFISS